MDFIDRRAAFQAMSSQTRRPKIVFSSPDPNDADNENVEDQTLSSSFAEEENQTRGEAFFTGATSSTTTTDSTTSVAMSDEEEEEEVHSDEEGLQQFMDSFADGDWAAPTE